MRDTQARHKEGDEAFSESDEYKSLPEQTAEQLDVLKYKLKEEEKAKAQAKDGEEDGTERGKTGTRGEETEIESPTRRPGS